MKSVGFKKLLALGAVVTLAACGKADPYAGYNLKGVPDKGLKSDSQGFTPPSFTIEAQSSLEFTQGLQGVATFKVHPTDQAILEYNVAKLDGPGDLRPVSHDPKTNDTIYNLTWMPGQMLGPKETHRAVKLSLEARITKASDARVTGANSTGAVSENFDLFVNRDEGNIQVRTSGLADGDTLDEEQDRPFDVVMKNGAAGATMPHVFFDQFERGVNKENFKADAHNWVRCTGNPAGGNGRWTDHCTFSTKGQTVPLPETLNGPDTKADSVKACFVVFALDDAGNRSNQQPVCVVVRYATQTPVITWKDVSSTLELQAGQEKDTEFTVSTPNQGGTVAVKSSSVATWPGKPTLTCKAAGDNDPSIQICHFTWNPECDAKFAKQYDLTVTATSSLDKRPPKTKQDKKTFTIKTDLCPAKPEPAKPAAKKPAPAPAPAQGGKK